VTQTFGVLVALAASVVLMASAVIDRFLVGRMRRTTACVRLVAKGFGIRGSRPYDLRHSFASC
jgi:integrase